MLSHPEYLQAAVQRILESRDELYTGFVLLQEAYPQAKLHVFKPDANFVYIQTPKAAEIFEYLKENGIIVRLTGGALRVSAGRNYENEAVLHEVEACLKGESA